MANIKVEKGQGNTPQVININPGDRVDFNFYQEDCVNSKDGNNHIVSFADGSQIIVIDFYIYSQNTMAFLSLFNESVSFSATDMENQSEEYKGVEGEINKLIAEGENTDDATTDEALTYEAPENETSAEARASSFNQVFTSENVTNNLVQPTAQIAMNNTELLDPVIFESPNLDVNIPENPTNAGDTTLAPVPPVPPIPEIPPVPEIPEAPTIPPIFKNENTDLEFRVTGIENINGDPHSSVGVSSAQVGLELESGSTPTFGFIDANGNEVNALNTKYGTITIDAQGQLVYTLNNSADLRALEEGSIINSTIQVFVKNSGGSDVKDVNITIHGSNDRPYWEFAVKDLALQANGVTGKDGANTITGVAYLEKTAEGKDDDASSSLTYSLESSASDTNDYGTFSFNTTTGVYSFTLDNSKSAVQNLLLNQTKTLEYVIKVTDEKGAYQESTIQVVITGGNHAPELDVTKNALVVSADSVETNNATVNGVVQDSGSSTNSDIDSNLPQASYSLASTDPNMSKYGTFVLNTNTGAYEFILDQTKADVQAMYKGESKELSFTVRVTDSANAYTEETIKVTITGGNDAPELSISKQLIVALGNTSDSSESTGTDQDHKAGNNEGLKYYVGSNGNLSAQDIEGLGTFTINETTGQYSYTLNSSTTTDNKHFEFTIYVYDKHGAYAQKTVSVEINPAGLSTNDLYMKESGYYQIGSGVANNNTSEYTGNSPDSALTNNAQNGYQQLSASGSTNYTGTGGTVTRFELVDQNGNVINGQSITSTYGTLVYRADGTYTYTLNYSKLEAGDSITETFYVRAVGTQNGVDKILTLPSAVTVTVHGTNDKPYFTLANGTIIGNTGSVDDNTGIYEHGVGRDNTDFTTVNPNISNNPFNVSNNFHNDNNNIFDTDTRVANGQLHSSDSNALDTTLVYSIAKDSGSTPSSWLENATTQITIQGTNGKITLNADGSYTYTLDNALNKPYNELAQGEKAEIDSFFVYVKDQYGAYTETKLVINVTGTNDKPEITGVTYVVTGSNATAHTNYIEPGGLAEDGLNASLNTNGDLVLKEGGYKLVDGSQTIINAGIASVKVNVTDVDNNDTHSFFLLQVEGSDGKNYLVTTNQAGQYGYTTSSGVFENIDVTDSSLKFSLVTKAFDQYGSTITIANSGTYTYYLNEENSAVQELHSKLGSGLDKADTLKSGFVVVAKDKAGAMHHKDVNVTIVGTEDKPVFLSSGDYKASSFHTLKESSSSPDGTEVTPGTDTASMKFKAQDFDSGDTDNLSYKAEFNNTPTNLDSSADGKTTEIVTQYGKIIFTFHNDADGKWFSYTYTLDNDKAHLFKEGQTFQEKIKIIASDPTQLTGEKELTFNIQGSNDAPTFTVSTTDSTRDVSDIIGTAKEDSNLSFSGDLHGADVDNGAVLSFSVYNSTTSQVLQILQGTYGKLEIDYYTGKYTYTLDDAASQKFPQGFEGYESFTVRVTDEFGAFDNRDIKITVTGTNDSPVISGTSVNVSEAGENSRYDNNGNTASEDTIYDNTNNDPLNTASPSVSGTIIIADVDDGDINTIFGSSEATVQNGIATYQGTYGTLTLNLSTGEYTYILNENNTETIQKLSINASVNESFDFIVKTTNNGSLIEETNSSINITINGINDKPYFTGNTVSLGGTLKTNGNITSDLPTTATIVAMDNTVLQLEGIFTGADIDTGDTFDFHLFGVRTTTGSYIAIKFDGTNYVRTDTNAIVQEKDLDIISTVKGIYGALTIKADGSYAYEIDINGPVWDLALGAKGTDIFTVTIKDQNGAWVTKELQIEVQTPDEGAFGSGTPADKTLYLDNILSSTDEEIPIASTGITPQDGSTTSISEAFIGFKGAGDKQVQTIVNDYGTLTINAKTGEYSFSFHNTEWVNSLAPGQEITFNYELMARNANIYLTGTNTAPTITITINGVADKPTVILEKNTFSVHEDTTYLDSANMEGKAFDRYWTSGMGEIHGDNTVAMNTLSYSFSYGQKTTTIIGARGEIVKGIMNSFVENEHFTLTFDEITGSLKFELTTKGNDLIQGLRTGENFNLQVSLQVTDKNGTRADPINITLTINGKNELPTLELAEYNYVFEDGATATQIPETVIINDKGYDKEYEVKQIVTGTANGNAESGSGTYGVEHGVNGLCIGLYGSLVIDKITGVYTYTLNNALASVQGLQEGEYKDDIFTITFTDSSGQTVTKDLKITLVGDADAPILTINNPFHEYLDGTSSQKTFTNQVIVQDKDLNDTQTYTLSKVEDGTNDSALLQLSYGEVTINATGEYTYTVDNELIKALARNETLTEKFWVKVTDSEGLTDTKEVVVTLTGENDAPEFDKPHFSFTQSGQELSGTLSATDPDHGAIVYYFMRNPDNSTTQVLDGKYGTLTIFYSTGEFVYTLKDGNTFEDLKLKNDENFTIWAKDEYCTNINTPSDSVTSQNFNIDFAGNKIVNTSVPSTSSLNALFDNQPSAIDTHNFFDTSNLSVTLPVDDTSDNATMHQLLYANG